MLADVPFTTTITGVITAVATLIVALSLLGGVLPALIKVLRETKQTKAKIDETKVAQAVIDVKLDVIHGLVNSTLTAAIEAELHATNGQLTLLRRVTLLDPTPDDTALTKALQLRVAELRTQLAERATQTAIGNAQLARDGGHGGA
jgi:Na+-transporting NADH:ubiquinone oxidoreductase subunit NqrC